MRNSWVAGQDIERRGQREVERESRGSRFQGPRNWLGTSYRNRTPPKIQADFNFFHVLNHMTRNGSRIEANLSGLAI
jgi:hypothetical protein